MCLRVMTPIPAFVVEEHHEALLVWNYALIHGWIPESGNTLLHIDEHADMGCPHLTISIRPLLRDLPQLWNFTYREISIYEFIVTAIYQGIFNRVCWLQPRPCSRQEQQVSVSSYQSRGKALRLTSGFCDPDSDGVAARYEVQDIHYEFAPSDSVVLDIDLDYFSCDQAENQVERLEVGETEYRSFQDNHYHFLRINQGNRVQARREGSRYFLYLKSYQDKAPCPLKVSEQVILARLELFRRYLERNKVTPRLINIARSRISGYTPQDQWQFIEENLIRCLSNIFDLDVQSFESIAVAAGSSPSSVSSVRTARAS